MIHVKLREAMENYRLATGKRLTYAELAIMSGVGEGTLSSIGSRLDYQANLSEPSSTTLGSSATRWIRSDPVPARVRSTLWW